MIRRAPPLAIPALSWLLACGADEAKDPPQTVVEVEAVPFDHTSVLDEDSMGHLVELSADGATLRFSGSTEQIEELAPGRVIVGVPTEAAPNGVLRRIDDVEHAGDELVVTTSATSPIFAFRRLRVHVEHPEGAPVGDPFRAGADVPVDVQVNWVVFDGDGKDATVQDRVVVTGELAASAGFDFDMGFDWGELVDIDNIFDLNPFDVLDDIGFYVEFDAELTASADIVFDGASALEFGDDMELAPAKSLGLIWVPGTPVWIIPRIHALAHVEGGASSRFSGHLRQEGSLSVGVQVHGSDAPELVGGVPQFSASDPSATLQAKAHVRASVEPRLELMVWGLGGPYAGIEPYVALDADIDRDPCWELSGGVDARFGVFVDLLLVSFTESFPVNLANEVLADGACELPPDGDGGGSLDPEFTPWAAAYPGTVQRIGTRDDRTSATRTHDGRFLIGATSAEGLFKIEDDGTPVWGRAYVRPLPAGPHTVRPQENVARLDGELWSVADDGTVLALDAAGRLLRASAPEFIEMDATRIGAALRTPDDGLVVAGTTAFADGSHGFVVRLGPAGDVSWALRMAGPVEEVPDAIVAVPEGWLVTGWARDAGSHLGFAMLLDEGGDVVWIHRLADCETVDGLFERDVEIHTAVLGEEGHYILGGSTLYGEYRSLMLAMSPEGEVLWSSQTAEPTFLGLDLLDMVPLESGGYMATGVWVWAGSNDATWIAETDAVGRMAWMHVYRGDSRELRPSVLPLPEENGMLLAGVTDSSFAGDVGAWVAELPRKHGVLELPADVGLERLELAPTEASSCIASVEWPGSVDAMDTEMSVIDDVEVDDLPIVHVALAP